MVPAVRSTPTSRIAAAAAALAAALLVASGFAAAGEGPSLAGARPLEGEPIMPIPPAAKADPRRVALGERLFADVRLSRDGTRACISCHDVESSGANRNRHDAELDGTPLPFNTPTVFNAALSFRLTWLGTVRDLKTHTEDALESPTTMGLSVGEAVARVAAIPALARRFRTAYGREPDGEALLDALTTYQRSLVTPGSRFDRWLSGDAAALTAAELDGYRHFKSVGCITCHQGVNVGGNLFQRQGVFEPLANGPETVRVPSLRNVAATAPYFHDGSAPTLAVAVRRMAAAQLGATLSDAETDAIVAFLNTLTGVYRGEPVSTPP
jgi:cytochrome c peroxidase